MKLRKMLTLTMTALLVSGTAVFANDASKTSNSNMPGNSNSTDNTGNANTTDEMGNARSARSTGNANTARMSKNNQMKKQMHHAVIEFDDASSTLTAESKDSLKNLVRNARERSPIRQVVVVAWSDKALPAKDTELSDSDENLADARAEAVERFLYDEMEVPDVDTFNMAESSNWLGRTFNTKEAELKSVFGRKGAEAPITNEEFRIIKDNGKPGTAVVVIEPDTRY